MRCLKTAILCLLCVSVLLPLPASEAASLLTRDFTPYSGEINFTQNRWSIRPASGGEKTVLKREFRAVQFEPADVAIASASILRLTNGSLLSGQLSNFRSGSPLTLKRIDSGDEIAFNIESIQFIEFHSLAAGASKEALPQQPCMVMRDGKVIIGSVQWLTLRDVKVETAAGDLTLKRDTVHRLYLQNPSQKNAPLNDDAEILHVTTVYGEHILGAIHSLDSHELALNVTIPSANRNPSTERLIISRRSLLAIRHNQGLFTYLTDLRPRSNEQRGYFTYHLPYQINHSLWGDRLMIGKRQFAHGIAMHSYCALTYELPGLAHSFSATIGLDTSLSAEGNAELRVESAGTVLATYQLNAQTPIQTITIDLTGQTSLTIIADFAEGGNSGDHVIIGEPIIALQP